VGGEKKSRGQQAARACCSVGRARRGAETRKLPAVPRATKSINNSNLNGFRKIRFAKLLTSLIKESAAFLMALAHSDLA